MYLQYDIADAVYEDLKRPPPVNPNADRRAHTHDLAYIPPEKKQRHYFTWDPVKGKWQESERGASPTEQSRATLENNRLNWPTEAPAIKIPAFAVKVSYNARHDDDEKRLRSKLGIPEGGIPFEILDSPLDDLEGYRGGVPHNRTRLNLCVSCKKDGDW